MAALDSVYPLDLRRYDYRILSCDPDSARDDAGRPTGAQRTDAQGRPVWRIHLQETAPGALAPNYQQEVSYHGPAISLPPLTPVRLVNPVVRHWATRDAHTGRIRASGLAISVDAVEPLEA